MPHLKAGLVVAQRYRLDSPLGAGGQGEVWTAWDLVANAQRAIKRIDLPSSRRRVWEEGMLAARLEVHPNLVSTLDVIRSGPDLLLVMNHVPGVPLSELSPVSDEEIFASVLVHTACALAHLHQADATSHSAVVHRDVKPANILVQQRDESATGMPVATLVDLGLVANVGARDGRRGTIEYMPPDVILAGTYVPEDDVYSLGAVGWHMLTGGPPHSARGLGPHAFARSVKTPSLASVSDVIPDWASAYSHVLESALVTRSPHPARRRGPLRPRAVEFAQAVAELAWPAGFPEPVRELLLRARVGAMPDRVRINLDEGAEPTPDDATLRLLQLARRRARIWPLQIHRGPARLRLTYGVLAERAGRRQEAARAFRSAADVDSPYGLARAGEALLGRDDPGAIELFSQADAKGSAFGALLLGRGLVDSDSNAAIEAFGRAAERGSAQGAWELVAALEATGDAEGVAAALDRAALLGHPEACQRAGKLAEELGRPTEAERLYRRAGTAEARYRRALLDISRGDKESAEEVLWSLYHEGEADRVWESLHELLKQSDVPRMWEVLREAASAGRPHARRILGWRLIAALPTSVEANNVLRAAVRGIDGTQDGGAALPLAVSELALGRPKEALALLSDLKAQDKSAVRLQGLVEMAVRLDLSDRTGAESALDRTPLGQVHPMLWQSIDQPLRELAGSNARAAYFLADCIRRRCGDPLAEDVRHELRRLYKTACQTGDQLAYADLAWITPDEGERQLALQAAAARGNAWAMSELFRAGIFDPWTEVGVRDRIEPALHRAAKMTKASDPDRAFQLLREAEAIRCKHASFELGHELVKRYGWYHTEVEHAFGRADLRGHGQAAHELGTLLYSKYRDNRSAIAAYRRAVARGAKSAWINLGVALERERDFNGAEHAYRGGLDAGDPDAGAWLALLLRDHLGRPEEALRVALETSPHITVGPMAHSMLGRFFADHDEHDKARRHLELGDEAGSAWAAYRRSWYLDPADAHAALDRAEARLHNATDALWLYQSDRHTLLRNIEEKRAGLPPRYTRRVPWLVLRPPADSD
jgi:hypothetical protein